MGLSLQTRLEKLEQRAREIGESNSNLVPLTIPWPDEDGGPIHCMVTQDFIDKLVKIYGHHSQQMNLTA
jgi:hypothetical protein